MNSFSNSSHFKIFFKTGRLACVAIGFATLVLFSSCTEFLKGKPKAQDYIEINSASLGCLDNVSEDMSKFLKAEVGEEAVDKMYSCLTDTLSEFQKKVEGRAQADAFTAEEIYDIFTQFVSQAKLSRTAADNLLLLKSALIGGAADRITKAEIDELKNYLGVVRNEAKKLTPYVKIFSFEKSNKALSKEFITAGFTQANRALKTLFRTSRLSTANYSVVEFKNFVINVFNLGGKEKNIVEILAKVNFVLNGYETNLTLAETDEYIDNVVNFMRLASLYTNGHFALSLEDFDQIDPSVEFVNEAITLVENSLQYKKTNVVSAHSLDRLMLELTKGDLFPNPVRASSLIGFYKVFITRLLESGSGGQVSKFTGIRPDHIANLKRELAVFQIYTRLIKKLIPQASIDAGDTHFDLRVLQSRMGALNPADEVDVLSRFNASQRFVITSIVNELKTEFTAANPAVYFYNKKMVVATNQADWKQSRQDLIQDTVIKVLSRFLMLGYAQQHMITGATRQTLNNVALYTWYGEFKAFLIDIKFFDPRIFNAGVTSVTVGNLFTRAGNGDDVLTYTELQQYFGILLAGSGAIGDDLYKDLLDRNCDLAELDVMGKHWSLETCLDTLLREKYKQYYASLPHLVSYLDRLSAADFKTYFREMTNIMRYSGFEGTKVETSDLSGLNTIAYFIENTFLLHDTNRNGALSESEIRAAYPKFAKVARDFAYSSSEKQIKEFNSWKATLAGFGCFSEDDLIRESFIFLVYNGRTPGTSDLNIGACFLGKSLITFKGEVDRMRITKALKSLKSILGP